MQARKQTSIKVDPLRVGVVLAWEETKEIFKEYSLTVSDAINIFLNKVRLEKGIPFDIKLLRNKDNSYFKKLHNRHLI